MKQFRVTEVELNFLKEMIRFLDVEGNSMSDEGSQVVKEMLSNINSRPVVDMIIDPTVIEEYKNTSTEDMIIHTANGTTTTGEQNV